MRKKKPGKGIIISVVTASVLLVIVVAVVGALLFTHSKNNPGASATATAIAQSTPATNGVTPLPTLPGGITPIIGNIGSVGQPVQAGANWMVTVTHTHETTSSLHPPDPGNTYLEISISLKNVSATPQPVSSVAQFTLLDKNGQIYDELKAVGDTNIHQSVDGYVAAGQTLNGQIAYQVPLPQHNFTLIFKYDFPDGGSSAVSWPLNV
jgi:flagellar basal body-associated protein FliL